MRVAGATVGNMEEREAMAYLVLGWRFGVWWLWWGCVVGDRGGPVSNPAKTRDGRMDGRKETHLLVRDLGHLAAPLRRLRLCTRGGPHRGACAIEEARSKEEAAAGYCETARSLGRACLSVIQ